MAKKKPQNGKAPEVTINRLGTFLGGEQPSQQQHSGPSPSQASQTIRCAEDIVLLNMLSSVPGPVRDFASQPAACSEQMVEGRLLSFDQEKQLATTLAFLSSVSDDSEHVTAVCIEEVPSTQGCKILVAINKATFESRNELLHKIKHGFEAILDNLARIPSSEFRDPHDGSEVPRHEI